ncbi:hypothetical protein PIECOFPK_00492 [Mycovorax composti]|uniref:DUF1735 domain-containing protein n=1 Tax=Mycovorax composti TaxID=2962693 RepID=A0ABZ2EH18_9BACT
MKKILLLAAIAATVIACKKSDTPIMPGANDKASARMMDEFFKKYAPKEEAFVLDAAAGGTITLSSGTTITFPAGVFRTKGGAPVTGNVNISARDILKASDMILANRPTLTSSGEMLESFGEIIVRARQNGEDLVLDAVKPPSVVVPIGLANANGEQPQRMEVPMWEGDTVITYTVSGHNHENQLVTGTTQVSVNRGIVWDQIPGVGFASATSTIFPLDRLGTWLNCDALYVDPRPKTTVLGYFGDKFNWETGNNYTSNDPTLLFFKTKNTNTLIKLYNVILYPAPSKEGLLSYQNSIPVGQEGTFLAMSAKDGKFYAEMRDVTIPTPESGKNYVAYTFNLTEVSESQLLNLIDQMSTK